MSKEELEKYSVYFFISLKKFGTRTKLMVIFWKRNVTCKLLNTLLIYALMSEVCLILWMYTVYVAHILYTTGSSGALVSL